MFILAYIRRFFLYGLIGLIFTLIFTGLGYNDIVRLANDGTTGH